MERPEGGSDELSPERRHNLKLRQARPKSMHGERFKVATHVVYIGC